MRLEPGMKVLTRYNRLYWGKGEKAVIRFVDYRDKTAKACFPKQGKTWWVRFSDVIVTKTNEDNL